MNDLATANGADDRPEDVSELASSTGTRAALQQWLRQAEELLAQERASSISPSFMEAIASDIPIAAVLPLRALDEGLSNLVGRLVTDPGRWILILEFGPTDSNLFIQFLVYEDGSLVAETVSNAYLEATQQLKVRQCEELERLGWSAPAAPRRPNWLVVEETRHPDVEAQVKRVLMTLRAVFELADEDEVTCTLFSSPRRGSTPASECTDNTDGVDDTSVPVTLGNRRTPNERTRSVDVNSLAARAARAWLIAQGLASEIERLRRPLEEPVIAAPGLGDLLEYAEGASLSAHEDAELASAAANRGDWSAYEDACDFARSSAEQAERAARQLAMLTLGVSAGRGPDPMIEHADRAAVAVLSSGSGLGRLRLRDVELFATTPTELVTEIAGLLCVVLVDRKLAVRIGPVRIWCDGADCLHVASDGEAEDLRWPSPVTVWEPASLVVDRIVHAGGVLPPTVSALRRGRGGRRGANVRSKWKLRRCPRCRELALVEIVYGLPDGDLFEAAERGEVALGGCVIEPDHPRYACSACEARFLTLRPIREWEQSFNPERPTP